MLPFFHPAPSPHYFFSYGSYSENEKYRQLHALFIIFDGLNKIWEFSM